ncbi:phosphatidylinositol transfer protein [Polyangium sp. 6x1]|uniref:LNS2 domain-containing protein n=1 Tax=Polyangium sp. 6x1 TaxID=3042689 RepID=UPI002482E19F|nr:phosphatidylinositol transfer protein [Polyangium sp. 6x1]MDI1446826.1 phosphatidylinositol transfer protein [Polyangium sp. 6x1]
MNSFVRSLVIAGLVASLSACADAPAQSRPPVTAAQPAAAPIFTAPPGPCALRPSCDTPFPKQSKRDFRHHGSSFLSSTQHARHRGRDLFLLPGTPQWVLGKFAYGLSDKDLKDEDIDVYLLRGCGASWEKVGTYRTSEDEGAHPVVHGVADRGGQIFVNLAQVLPGGPLGVGRHRIKMVVAGDGTSADVFLEVLPEGARIAVTDIDGTLTEKEEALVGDVLTGGHSATHPGAAEVMRALSGRGFFLFYLTARPHWLEPRTREWLALRGFPPGIVHTSVTSTGRMGEAAASFKMGELGLLKTATGLAPELAFGNMPSDVAAYASSGIPKTFYYKLDDDARGGVKHDDYRTLLPSLGELSAVCP